MKRRDILLLRCRGQELKGRPHGAAIKDYVVSRTRPQGPGRGAPGAAILVTRTPSASLSAETRQTLSRGSNALPTRTGSSSEKRARKLHRHHRPASPASKALSRTNQGGNTSDGVVTIQPHSFTKEISDAALRGRNLTLGSDEGSSNAHNSAVAMLVALPSRYHKNGFVTKSVSVLQRVWLTMQVAYAVSRHSSTIVQMEKVKKESHVLISPVDVSHTSSGAEKLDTEIEGNQKAGMLIMPHQAKGWKYPRLPQFVFYPFQPESECR
ncbi:unnamed protein product [Darwinula stevensoni]|uniref:Uncharacterized protein n=1 Tax=Darwinula stevensoni TaxID=69355 RepID=A0A7R8X7D0_9CRUS|nr:unnamed protein product [Darwinula stevensoni]CAG0889015.1 unnamed protein product [Darwinula stevensoni]